MGGAVEEVGGGGGGGGRGAEGGVTLTPIPMSPFIPPAACPGTEQRNSYFPFFVNTIVSVAFCPCLRIGVALPTQLFFAVLDTGSLQILKLWKANPMFVTLKMVVPAGSAESFDSLKASSVGLPAVTVTTFTLAVLSAFT